MIKQLSKLYDFRDNNDKTMVGGYTISLITMIQQWLEVRLYDLLDNNYKTMVGGYMISLITMIQQWLEVIRSP